MRQVRCSVRTTDDLRRGSDLEREALVETSHLPGHDLVEKGLADLARGERTAESLLVSIGASRLRRLGFALEVPFSDAERGLYDLLAEEGPDAAHSRYNALVRKLVSFERAAECVGR